jgi:SAM-dependent methyltransferase
MLVHGSTRSVRLLVVAFDPEQRRSMWEYYDRRVVEGVRGLANANDYWSGLGVVVEVGEIASEALQVERQLEALGPARFVEVGCGPGTFTSMLAGSGVVVDQSDAALRFVGSQLPHLPAVRAVSESLPLRDKAVDRFFAAHLYGLLEADERHSLLQEARRVAHEIIILDAGRPPGVNAEEWQDRTLPDGGSYRIYRRHFDPTLLAEEIRGHVLFAGRFYVLARAWA